MGHTSGAVRTLALVGASAQIRAVLDQLERIAETDAPVVLIGEPGTGKFQIAELLHRTSRRSTGPFVTCNLGGGTSTSVEVELFGRRGVALARPEHPGAFALAHRGTLFLEDLENLDDAVQPTLLGLLAPQEIHPFGAAHGRSYDVRVISSANRDLEEDVRANRIHPDLYRRLAVLRVDVPPIRERREDIPLLVDAVLGELAPAYGRGDLRVSPAAMDALCRCDWPGNIRELRAVLEQAVSGTTDETTLEAGALHLDPLQKRSGILLTRSWQPFKEAKEQLLEEWETEYLRAVIERARGNIALAARYAGLARGHVYRLLKKHNI